MKYYAESQILRTKSYAVLESKSFDQNLVLEADKWVFYCAEIEHVIQDDGDEHMSLRVSLSCFIYHKSITIF